MDLQGALNAAYDEDLQALRIVVDPDPANPGDSRSEAQDVVSTAVGTTNAIRVVIV